MLIPDSRLEAALTKLAATDGPIAELHANVERNEYRAKAVKDAIFLRSEGSVAERNAIAGTHPEYTSAMENYFSALQAHDTMKNERNSRSFCHRRRTSAYETADESRSMATLIMRPVASCSLRELHIGTLP